MSSNPKKPAGAPETDTSKPSKKPQDTAKNEATEANLDSTVSEINKELQAMAPGMDGHEVVAMKDDEPEINLDAADDVLSDSLADEMEKAEDQPIPETAEEEPVAETESTTPDIEEPSVEESDDELEEEAVDDIVAEESSADLETDEKSHDEHVTSLAPPKKQGKFKKFISNIWEDPKKRWLAIGGTVALLLAISMIPHSRYFVLNSVGIRSSLQLTVIDGTTLQPLKNVTVRAGGAEAKTDSEGLAHLQDVRLGNTILQIEKRAFSPIDRPITIGWGSNPMGEFRATAVGTQYTILVKDFLSGKPIDGAEAASGEGNASSDENGRLVLTLDTAELDDAAQVSIDITAGAYRAETLNITVNNKEEQSVEMVPARKHVYVSKRSGKYDVYTAHVDGKNEERIVGGTGYERDDIALIPHPKDEVAALVATRENTRNPNGYLLSTLYVLDTSDGELVKIDQSEQIQVVGWSKSGRLIYVKIAAGASGTDPKRHRLMSFNNNDFSDTKELASSNSFNDVMMAADRIYFAPSNMFQENQSAGFYAMDPDGKNPQTVLDKEVFTVVRSSYGTLHLSLGESWYTYETGSSNGAKPGSAPSSVDSKIFTDNTATQQSLWVDNRDGKGVLLGYDKASKEEKTLDSRSGLKLPVYWLSEKYAVFRVRDSRETADYIMNIEGGEARKITDVTDTAGIGRWFYY